MALKATIYKIQAELADMDRNLYCEHSLTIASHPSETPERMMVRFLAFMLNVTENNDFGELEFAKDICETDGPSVWQKNLTGEIEHWIELGQPDERRLLRACGKSRRVSVYAYGTSVGIWWSGIAEALKRTRNLTVWQLPAAETQALAALAGKTMKLHVSVQDGTAWVADGARSVEVNPVRLMSPEG